MLKHIPTDTIKINLSLDRRSREIGKFSQEGNSICRRKCKLLPYQEEQRLPSEVEFCTWFCQENNNGNNRILKSILLSDEVTFTRNGLPSVHNIHLGG